MPVEDKEEHDCGLWSCCWCRQAMSIEDREQHDCGIWRCYKCQQTMPIEDQAEHDCGLWRCSICRSLMVEGNRITHNCKLVRCSSCTRTFSPNDYSTHLIECAKLLHEKKVEIELSEACAWYPRLTSNVCRNPRTKDMKYCTEHAEQRVGNINRTNTLAEKQGLRRVLLGGKLRIKNNRLISLLTSSIPSVWNNW